ncbi:MAG TPA: hypothetical protein OIM11_08555 [Coriobacteriaceae bacterium]|nr:hypothetical protein [Coriobacteriaceae bacterium]
MPTRALLRASTAVVAMLTFVVCAACVLQTTQFACADGTAQVMYRLYNPNSGEHFYTADVSERDAVAAAGWSYEGEGWTAPTVSSTPVYRLYSGTDHHYCTGEGEKDALVAAGWSYEGIGWYSDDAKGVPLYRQFNPNVDPTAPVNNSGSHNYTTSLDEHKHLVSIGWNDEGIGWYGVDVVVPGDGSVSALSVSSVSLGDYHSAAILGDGSLWTWGRNDYGCVGDGTTEDRTSPVKVMDGARLVSVGDRWTASVGDNGSLWTWGRNWYGSLGDGTTEDRLSPVKIMDGVTSAIAGAYEGAAIKEDGTLWMWGDYYRDRSGDFATEEKRSPVCIMNDVASISLGGAGGYAVIKEDDSLWTWGSNSYGELGIGTTEDASVPVKVMDDVNSVSLGEYYGAAIKKDGTLWMWGLNNRGQLGDGTTESKLIPVKVMDSVRFVTLGDSNFGSGYSMATREDGSVWAWGANHVGQLGDGTTEDKLSPIKVMDSTRIAWTTGSSTSLALDTDGSIWGWGGVLYPNYTNHPTRILDGVKDVYWGGGFISAGQYAAIKNDGSVWTWGNNDYGQLGNGTTENSNLPVRVQFGS